MENSKSATDLAPGDEGFYVMKSSDQMPLGLPMDFMDYMPPGFQTTTASFEATPAISSVDTVWDTIKDNSSGAIDWAGDKLSEFWDWSKKPLITIPNPMDIVDERIEQVQEGSKTIFWYAIVGVIVIAGAMYFIGRGGAIGQATSFGK